MARPNEEKLLQAIEKDDVKAFNALMQEARCGSYRLGRFPVLSVLYLFGARRILSAYEAEFLKIPSWEELGEPAMIVKRFSDRAGKCLRLYFHEVVSPLEMLLILDQTKKVKKLYPQLKTSEAVKARLKSIYSVKYSLGVRFEGNQILFDRRPLTRSEKKRLTAVCTCCALAAAIVVAVPVTASSLLGTRSGGEVTRVSHIDFAAQTTYTLKSDLKIPANYSVKAFNCNIEGGGHKLILGKNATLGALNGKLSDVEIQTTGSPIFSVCGPTASLENVVVNVDADVKKTAAGNAFIADTNYGLMDGVTLNVRGSLSALAGSMNGTQELVFGGMVATNSYTATFTTIYYAVIQNCTVNYLDFTLKGETMANATFGGIVGVNNGVVQDCRVTGAITADTFDLGGACYVNGYTLSGITSEANLSQTALGDGWTPIVSGIVIENASRVERCQNLGNLSVVGTDALICGGIAARTYGQINECISSGDISATGQTAYVGSIFGRSEVVSSGRYVYCGFADRCLGTGKIVVTGGGEESCVGGIGGFVQEGVFNQQTLYLGGGVTNSIFLGEIQGEFRYFGSLVGACGEDIYEKNSYTSGDKELANFDGNYYLKGAPSAFGAVVSAEEVFRQAADKGATAATEEEIKNTDLYQELAELFHL